MGKPKHAVMGLGILTYNRPDILEILMDSIDFDLFDWVVVVIDGGGISYDDVEWPDGVKVMPQSENRGVAACKNIICQQALEDGVQHLYMSEDDAIVENNEIWKLGIEWSASTGIQHWAHNHHHDKMDRCFGDEYDIRPGSTALVSYHTRDMLEKFSFDEGYYNLFEHVDQEFQMCQRGYLPPFWYFVQPPALAHMIKPQIVDSSIDTQACAEPAMDHWMEKYGFPVGVVGKESWRSVRNSLTALRDRFGTPAIVKGVRRMAIVTTIKDRMVMTYNKPEHLTETELQQFGMYDGSLQPLVNQYKDEPSFKLNQLAVGNPHFALKKFLETFHYWAHRVDGVEPVMCITDFESKDGDPEQLMEDMWGDAARFDTIEAPGGDKVFNRGLGLNIAADLEEDADFYFFTDADCKLLGNNVLEHGNIVTQQDGALFPIFHKEMSPNGIYRYIEWAGNGQSFVPKELHDRVGGFPEYWSWGKEDSDYRQRLIDAGACVICDDYPDLVHMWHSTKISAN